MDQLTKLKIFKRRIQRLASKGASKASVLNQDRSINADQGEFTDLLAAIDDDLIFAHAGLSDINHSFQCDPYAFLVDELSSRFDNVVAPGFTPSFRSSGIYHKKFSRPEYGAFSRLFLGDADYRTNDAIHSVLVKGELRLDHCDHENSFGESSVWAYFDERNSLCINIGTDDFITTQLHYIEVKNDLPYVNQPNQEGIIYYNESEHDQIIQTNYEYKISVSTVPNWKKIRRYLISRGVVNDHSIGGLTIYLFRARDIRKELESKLEDDPYFLIT